MAKPIVPVYPACQRCLVKNFKGQTVCRNCGSALLKKQPVRRLRIFRGNANGT